MAEPVRRNEPLRSMRFPESPGPGPVPVTKLDPSRELVEHTTDKPLGERPVTWPEAPEKTPAAIESAVQRAKQITAGVQDRVEDLRHRFRRVRGRAQAGELQEELKQRASDIAGKASRRARIVRNRSQLYARNHPVTFIAGAAVAGFTIGFMLRLGRDQ